MSDNYHRESRSILTLGIIVLPLLVLGLFLVSSARSEKFVTPSHNRHRPLNPPNRLPKSPS